MKTLLIISLALMMSGCGESDQYMTIDKKTVKEWKEKECVWFFADATDGTKISNAEYKTIQILTVGCKK